jgi:hypothetical protein
VSHPVSRREVLKNVGCGFGYLALAGLAAERAAAAETARPSAALANPLAPKAPHFPPRAKRVVFLFMQGGSARSILMTTSPDWPATTAR